jgi:ribonuclease P protein component
MKQTLNKKDRLKSYSKIRELFDHGVKLRQHPLTLFYLLEEGKATDGVSMKMGVAVGARHFKKAVQRNLLKRRIKEAYRLQRSGLQEFITTLPFNLSLFFVYADHSILEYEAISNSVKLLLEKCQASIMIKSNELNRKND